MRPLNSAHRVLLKQAVPGLAKSKKVLRLLSLRSACSASAILSGSSFCYPLDATANQEVSIRIVRILLELARPLTSIVSSLVVTLARVIPTYAELFAPESAINRTRAVRTNVRVGHATSRFLSVPQVSINQNGQE